MNAYRFTRCTAVRSDGARCWRPPYKEGKHICLRPGEVPSASAIKAVADLHPDADSPEAIMMMAALEPVGRNTPEGAAQVHSFLRDAGWAR